MLHGRRPAFGVLLLTTVFAHPVMFRAHADLPPAVTAKGSVGDEDVPDLTIPHITLAAGDTLLVSSNDEGGDVEVYWNDKPLHRDVGMHGSGYYTTVFSLYSATGGTGDIFASHVSAGDLTINAYSVSGLAPSALDKTSTAQGVGTNPSSGATAPTSRANEFLWGTIGYATNLHTSGNWNGGFISGTQYTNTGGIGGVEDGYKTVSSMGAYTAAKTGVDKDAWTAVIATYALTAASGPVR